MTPDQLAARLRHIADKLDRSSQPSISAVAAELGELSSSLQVETYDAVLSSQEAQGVAVGRAKRSPVLSLNVADQTAYDRTMAGLSRRASKK